MAALPSCWTDVRKSKGTRKRKKTNLIVPICRTFLPTGDLMDMFCLGPSAPLQAPHLRRAQSLGRQSDARLLQHPFHPDHDHDHDHDHDERTIKVECECNAENSCCPHPRVGTAGGRQSELLDRSVRLTLLAGACTDIYSCSILDFKNL